MRVLVILLLLSGIAHADKATAERYFRAGAKAYSAQNFAAAATNFDEAYKQLAMPEIAFSAAQAYRLLYQVDPKPHHVRRAIELYQMYLAEVKKGGRVSDAANNLADMKRELDRLTAAGVSVTAAAPAVAKTRLGINVSLPDQRQTELGALTEVRDDSLRGITATIDGAKVEPFTLVEVDAKEHVVSVTAEGYFPVEKKTVAVEGQSTLVDVELRAKPARVTIKTEDDARIAIDGRYVATSPAAALELGAGKHYISVMRSGRQPFARELAIGRGQDVAITAPLAKTGQRKAVPWVLGGAGVLLAGAVTTGVLAVARDRRAQDLRGEIEMGDRPTSDADAYDSAVAQRDRFATWTWILGGAALTTGAVGSLMFFFDTPTADAASVGVAGRF